jgi:hypothetical protein
LLEPSKAASASCVHQIFKTLSKDAQCQLIWMFNRRGRLFRHGAFRYAEIADAQSALEELRNCDLVRSLVEGDGVDFILCLRRRLKPGER